ncbi:MAG: hypothetical protein KJ927_11155, partial [Candidatus Eisenbacteria bacterium]|nr:hypothetical protein [Candidatus Eisenbacteria bacterium]
LGVRFTPPTYPCKVVAAKFYVTRTYEDCSVCNVLILDDDGSSGAPGSTIFGPTEAGPADSTGWMRYNIPTEDQFVVETGDFYINWIYEGCGTLGLSGGATHPERQWADIFGDWAIFHEDLSFMIRAIVEAENVPTWEYTWGHIKRLYE